ncbi:MobF family relaxase [Sphingomonas sp. BIUV-7]|uniref:MobF family relaxase n=1 Tax=Sphingomonas natans TaxID=3063330 RepID=A0ABT8Y9M7_9SPHN|nr:MobF family relaxase [Sphingomonas sp. BIUV-7]MDO6414360.1 MobF family relaxase [Sphingomonas sp. BIUV-7]
MLSMASVRSAGGSAKYFAADNYYTNEAATEASEWIGAGSFQAGLSGPPTQEDFRAVLEGKMPDGSVIPTGANGKRAYGSDFTFSAPKSVSLLALVGGDTRLVEAHQQAVKEAIGWAEKNLAQARVQGPDGVMRPVKTGNLVVGLFLHDTNREQEPQLHSHTVIANATRDHDGKWRALDNRPLWAANTLLGSIYHASLRNKIAALGYITEPLGKHGTFEISGIGRELIQAFSTRREQILAAIADRRLTPAQQDLHTLQTRGEKAEVEDRGKLYQEWRDKAATHGVDLAALADRAASPTSLPQPVWGSAGAGLNAVAAKARALASFFADRLGMDKTDPLMPPSRSHWPATPEKLATAQSVASAIRHLSEREAGFTIHDIYRTALNFDLPGVSIEGIERRVAELVNQKVVFRGTGKYEGYMTTAQAISIERAIMQEAKSGVGADRPLMAPDVAEERLQAAAMHIHGFHLNAGQLAAGRQVLSTRDRVIAIQGVAGAGKSTALLPLRDVLKEEGKSLVVMSFMNELVQGAKDAGIEARTIDSFVGTHQHLLDPGADRARIDKARDTYRDTVFIIDEGSMTSNVSQLKLNRLVNLLQLRMPNMGDERQLGAISAGKPFEIMQRLGLETAHMPENLRATTDNMKRVNFHLYDREPERAFVALSPYVVIAPDSIAETATSAWLALSPEMREQTGLYADGRALKAEANALVQQGLLNEGSIGVESVKIEILDRESLSQEEIRYPGSYRPGQTVIVNRQIRSSRLWEGEYTVGRVDKASGSVSLQMSRLGRSKQLLPQKIRPDGTKPSPIDIYEARELTLHRGDRIRFGSTDKTRGIWTAQQARVIDFSETGVTLEIGAGTQIKLPLGDPILRRIDLAYAQNVHMLQGKTDTHAIAMLDSRNTKLVTQRALLVAATRVRESLIPVMDDKDRYIRLIKENTGDKTSALEVIGEVPDRSRSRTTHRPGDGSLGDGGQERPELPADAWERAAAAFFDGAGPGSLSAGEPAAGALTSADAAGETKRAPRAPGSEGGAKPAPDRSNGKGTPGTADSSRKPELEKHVGDGDARPRQIELDL